MDSSFNALYLQPILFIIAVITAVVAFIKYITKKHDEHYDAEITRLDTKVDSLKELVITKIDDIKQMLGWGRNREL